MEAQASFPAQSLAAGAHMPMRASMTGYFVAGLIAGVVLSLASLAIIAWLP
jgi:hypothetical protein